MPSLKKSKKTKESFTKLLKKITKSRRSQHRASTTKKKLHLHDPHVEIKAVLQSYFDALGYEIQQTNPNYIPPSADEFLYICKQVDTELRKETLGKKTQRVRVSPSIQTVLSLSPLQKGGVLDRVVAKMIGTFDTPCEAIFSCLNIACYAAGFVFYGVQRIDSDAPHLESLEMMWNYLGVFVQNIFPTMASQQHAIVDQFRIAITPYTDEILWKGTAAGITTVLQSALNNMAFRSSFSCLLLLIGIQSCYPLCGHVGR